VTQQWFERQLLPPRHGISIADVVARAGWIPSAGGTGPYLAIRARIPAASEDVFQLGTRGPSLRGAR
jgi:hypothetical protein